MNVRAHRAWWSMSVCAILGAILSGRAGAAITPSEIVLYAIDATNLHGNWTRAADNSAGGGQVLTSTDAGASNLTAPLSAAIDYADFSFPLPPARATASGFACARRETRSGTIRSGPSSPTPLTRRARRRFASARRAA